MTLSILLGAAVLQLLALSFAMTVAWGVQQRTGNSGWIDAVWTCAVGVVGVASALWPLGEETSARQILVAALISAWAVRLGWHIASRSAAKSDDPRYAELVRGWGVSARSQMFVLLQKQALVSLPLVFSVFIAAHHPATGLGWADAAAVLVFAVAVAGESLADRQLRAFARASRGGDGICVDGLWRFSRHPNYFFEWVHWLAYPIIAISPFDGSYPAGWLALTAPLVMYWLLRYVSGVPPLEEHMVRKHGDRYRAYQASTAAFFPCWPKRGSIRGSKRD